MIHTMRLLKRSQETSSREINSNLPNPELKDLEQSLKLTQIIFDRINAQPKKCISFYDYMNLVLYHENYGYYTSPKSNFGSLGDFITAPLVSPLFSKCIAAQIGEVLHYTEGGDILELGAGLGTMARDILLELNLREIYFDHYYIVEISPNLIKAQLEHLQTLPDHLFKKVKWINGLPNFKFKGVILGNEVLDALPVHYFNLQEDKIFEWVVIEKENEFYLQKNLMDELEDSNPTTLSLYFEIKKLIDENIFDLKHENLNYNSEINLIIENWINTLSKNFERGVMLFIDYGFSRKEYYHPDRNMGTLMCHYRHFVHGDFFLYPGLQDITAHVDFTKIAECGVANNLNVLGFTNQASFLIANEITNFLGHSGGNCTDQKFHNKLNHYMQHLKQNQAIELLTSPSEMGELFKVIALGQEFDEPLKGFKLNDMRYKL